MRGIRTISTILAIAATSAACSSNPSTVARTPAVCEALRPAMPIAYHSKGDTADTADRIKQANARYAAACP